jgi:hypothetical protein
MRKLILISTLLWINTTLLSGCAGSKASIFDGTMPTMKEIHDEKFGSTSKQLIEKPCRAAADDASGLDKGFQWLPNPTLNMYVFKHLTPAGYPVPGYSTFFRLYAQDHIAEPSEKAGWE